MNYKEQLESTNWKAKRNEILKRDNYRCTNCNTKASPYLNFSRKFGIKSYSEMISEGYSITHVSNDIRSVQAVNETSSQTVSFIEQTTQPLELEKLFFALRWNEGNDWFIGAYQLICFYKEIKPEEILPILNIHHKYYVENKLAWEYNNEVLITLCDSCHKIEHEKAATSVFDENGKYLYSPEKCDRCFGSGYLPVYKYYKNGICFKCGGNGVILRNFKFFDDNSRFL